MIERDLVYDALDSERAYQDSRWGKTQSGGRPGHGDRTLDEFILYIGGYAQQLVAIGAKVADPAEKLEFVRKVGGLCVAAMEQHGAPRREGF
jgi:hypothetical protein